MPSQVASSRSTSPAVSRSLSAHTTPPGPLPVGEVRWRQLDAEVPQHRLVDALVREFERHLVDRVDVARGHHRADRQVREQRDLLADVLAELLLGAAHHHVGLDADAAQLLNRVLRGLRLKLARVAKERHQGEVYEHAAVAPDLRVELAQRLEERQRLDVADRAADLGDHDVHVGGLGYQLDAVLDLVRDMRNHLYGAAEVVTAALASDHRVVDRTGGGVGGAARVRVGEALVVPEVEVGLGAVLRDEHLAVLERAHRARVDVDVRVEFLDRHGQSARYQQSTQRSRRDALPQCGDNAAGDKDEAGFRAALWHQVSGKSSVLIETADDSEGMRPPRAHAAASSSFACLRAALSEASAPSIRHSSATTPSPSSASTVVRAVSVSADFSIRKCAIASAAICGRWVMLSTWRVSPSARSRSPTARAVCPPTPASTSSKTSVRDSPVPATVISASMTRESSPPEAASRIGAAGAPGLGPSMNSTRSAPAGPTSSRGSTSTSKAAFSIASAASSSRTRSASRGAA